MLRRSADIEREDRNRAPIGLVEPELDRGLVAVTPDQATSTGA
jgi:hypothetical protein